MDTPHPDRAAAPVQIDPSLLDFETLDSTERSRQIMREWCKRSLYYLCTKILGMDLLLPHVHRLPCAFLDTRPYPRTTRDEILFQMPRDYFKSTIATIGASLQDILRDPTTSILVVNEQEDNVKHFIRAVKKQFEANKKLQWLFPELIPDFSKTRWSDLAMQIRRPEQSYDRPEATIEGVGVAGTVVSRHYDCIILDDLIGLQARYSPAVMRRAKEWIKLAEHLFASQAARQLRCVGTPWAYDDVYGEFRHRPGVREFVLPVEVSAEEYQKLIDHTDHAKGIRLKGLRHGIPTFPEAFPPDILDEMYEHEGSYNFSCMMLLDPINPDNTRFKPHWLSWYRFDKEDGAILPLQDGKAGSKRLHRKDLYVATMVDPATDKKTGKSGTAVVTWGRDKEGFSYLLDAWWKHGATPTQVCERLIETQKRYKPSRIGWEDYTFFGTYRGMIRQMAADRGETLHIVPVKAGRAGDKEQRIGTMDGMFQSGDIYVREGLADFLSEYNAFPAGRNDLLDATYYCLRHEQPLLRSPDGSPARKAAGLWHERQLEKYTQSVDPVTGYGS